MILAFIDELRGQGFAVESICQILSAEGLKIAARTYRAWARSNQQVAARTITDASVEGHIRGLAFTTDRHGNTKLAPEGLYGRRKMTALIRRSLPGASRGAVDRAMRSLGLAGVRRGKGVRTTIPAKDGVRAGDLLNRDFTADAPNRVWVADFTYVRTWAGWAYVAFIVDVYAQQIIGWNAATTRETELVDIPLRMAIWQRDREAHPVERGQLISHSDAGSRYTSVRFTEHLQIEGIRPSIGTVADAYDNSLMESIIGLFKTECIRTDVFHEGSYRQLADVEFATAGWVDWWNNRRLHGARGNLTPVEYERAYYAANVSEPQPV
ncbi:transposase [Nesterenkonia jeotgali]|uniref:Transposase n=1 Tax=Nesterenkonia jeotgali TaxID=317018 RepID=A0A0W8IFD4_9MICC|nr:transposase [Nesterenkonia jeotgali]